jgi:hypothetical protein
MFATLLCANAMAEEVMVLQSKNMMPKYELITNISLGPFGYTVKDKTERPYRYRVIVSTFEIYDDLFIEKLKINDEEGIPQGVDWSRMLDLKLLLVKLNVPAEQQKISKIKWLTPTSLRFILGGKPIVLKDIRQLKMEAIIN